MKIFNVLMLPFLVISSILANDQILSPSKQASIEYSKEKLEQDSLKLKKDWINPITYTYTQQDGNQIPNNKKSILSISQPIFKSGGIYSAIKYAYSLEKTSLISINLEEKELIKQATQTLFNIHKNILLLEKQKLLISNAIIDIENKQESVLNGLLDVSFLNNAILDANRQKENLVELEFQQISLINNFDNFTSKPYSDFELPVLKLLDEESYLTNNMYIKQSKINTNVKEHFKDVTIAKYLPTINANYNYTNDHSMNMSSNVYGFNVVVPLNIRYDNDISSGKIDFLKSKNQERITAQNERNILKTQIAKVKMIDKKIELTKENIKSFESLLMQMKELEKAELKTKDDVAVLDNSKMSEALDIKIFEIDKQIELLELYARINAN